jgi:hypothetical protein
MRPFSARRSHAVCKIKSALDTAAVAPLAGAVGGIPTVLSGVGRAILAAGVPRIADATTPKEDAIGLLQLAAEWVAGNFNSGSELDRQRFVVLRIRPPVTGTYRQDQPAVGLLPLEVGAVPLVFAEHFKDVGIGQEIVGDLDGKGLDVHLWVVEGHFDIQVSEVAAAETFRDAQSVAMRVALSI